MYINEEKIFTLCLGVFDHFHAGHRFFLTQAANLGKPLLIALDESEGISEWSVDRRRREVSDFLSTAKIPYEIIIYKNNQYDAIYEKSLMFFAISQRQREVANAINNERIGRKLAALPIVEFPLFYAKDSLPLYSERIRQGQVDREGAASTQRASPKSPSKIRNNFVEIFLAENGPLYGYQLNKKYVKKFGALSLRLTYYHLGKGVSEGIFKIVERKTHSDGYSWGKVSERTYYSLA